MRHAALFVTMVLAAALCATSLAAAPRPLVERGAPTPRFRLPCYATSGRIPEVVGDTPAVNSVDEALRLAVRDDQRAYAKSARRYVGKVRCRRDAEGIYRTYFHRSLTSASTVVVSALIPALKLYPLGNDGEMWISVTVDIRTGKRVSLAKLVRSSAALPVLARAWGPAWLRSHRNCRQCRGWLRRYRPSYPARFGHLRTFALTPTGLAIGFPMFPAGSRLVAVIPYWRIRGELSPLGLRLVDGVRRSLRSQ